jgi:hypothetical protein
MKTNNELSQEYARDNATFVLDSFVISVMTQCIWQCTTKLLNRLERSQRLVAATIGVI